MQDDSIKRRSFLQTCCTSALGLGLPLATFSLSSCSGIHFATGTVENGALRIDRSEFTEQREGVDHNRPYVLIQTESSPFPICVHRQGKDADGQDKFSAALLSCTHNVCELNVSGQMLICPCHGSEFTLDGTVVRGPANENLVTFKTRVDHGNIWISKN